MPTTLFPALPSLLRASAFPTLARRSLRSSRWFGLLALFFWACEPTTGEPCGESLCKAGEGCVQGRCQALIAECPVGSKDCAGRCTLVSRDPQNCGECGVICGDAMYCEAGRCACWPELSLCSGSCVRLATSQDHCGRCGLSCGPRRFCDTGKCACWPGLETCSGECVDLKAHTKHCGACGRVCPSGEVCSEGRCLPSCPPQTPTDCQGGCVSLQTDRLHCGRCENACDLGLSCASGRCGCSPPWTLCKGLCVSLDADQDHCGQCGNACTSGQICLQGTCSASCPLATPTACFGGCFDTSTDRRHCGGCGQTCPLGETCNDGICRCPLGWQRCKTACVDLQQNRSHCGNCGQTCLSGELCVQGLCKATPWLLTFGGSAGTDTAAKIVIAADRSLYLIGSFAGHFQLPPYSIPSRGDSDIFLAKLSPAGSPLWIKTFGSTFRDIGYDIVLDTEGRPLITGEFQDTLQIGTLTLRSVGDRDAFAAKFDTDGTPLWARSFGSSGWDSGYRIAVDPAGYSYITGRFQNQILLGSSSIQAVGANDAFLVKLDPQGNILTGIGFGSSGYDDGYGIEVSPSGAISVVGQFQHTMKILQTTLQSRNLYDGFFLRFHPDLSLEWASTFGGNGNDTVRSSALDVDGDLYAIGSFNKPVTIGNKTFSSRETDLLLGKIGSNGLAIWVQHFSSEGIDSAGKLHVDPGKHTYATGTFAGNLRVGSLSLQGKRDPAASPVPTAFLVKVDPQGKPLWGITADATLSSSGRSVALDPQGGLFWLGTFEGTLRAEGQTATSQGANEIFLLRLDTPNPSPP